MNNNNKNIISIDEIEYYLNKTHICYRLYIYDCVLSTNDIAKAMIQSGNAFGSIIIANKQSAGRGKNERSFFSPDGGIYISFIFSEKQIPYSQNFLLFAPSVAVCITIEKLLGIQSYIKWPNDIFVDNKKVCGILTETRINAGNCNIIIGIGVNYLTQIETFPSNIKEIAGSLKAYTKNITKNAFLAMLIMTIDDIILSFKEDQCFLEYKKRIIT